MKYFIYRNTTIEKLFNSFDAEFSGYDDISEIPSYVDGYIWFYNIPIRFDIFKLVSEINAFYYSIELLNQRIPSTKPFYIFTLAPIYTNIVEIGDFKLNESIKEFNNKIISLSSKSQNIKILDFQAFVSGHSLEQVIDWKFYYLSKMLVNPKLSTSFQQWFSLQINAIQSKRKKCLILDLDNTLWGGILGEDGISGIKIGGDYPGNAFQDFQMAILELYKAGIILAICSKNNESDVLEAWDKNPNIIIKKEHLAIYRINWKNKAENIAEIIKQLNIGSDSVVFLDDNPTERVLINQFIPLVETPEFPTKPYMLSAFIKELTEKHFQVYQLTNEDKIKTKQYQENADREEFQNNFLNFDEYLSSLEIVLEVKPANSFTVPRIAQMTQKTNQFNLTTKRYTESDILNFIKQDYWIFTVSVNDRFGDNGITGLIIIQLDLKQSKAEVDSFLLSCRILGKGIEDAFVFTMFNKLKEAGVKELYSTYVQSYKNEQVKLFYDKLGFELINDSISNNKQEKKYILNLDKNNFSIKPFYKIIK